VPAGEARRGGGVGVRRVRNRGGRRPGCGAGRARRGDAQGVGVRRGRQDGGDRGGLGPGGGPQQERSQGAVADQGQNRHDARGGGRHARGGGGGVRLPGAGGGG